MVVVIPVRPAPARDTAGWDAGVGYVACGAWKRMPKEKHATRGGCQALRRNKANDFRWMQLKPIPASYSARVMKTLFGSSM